MTGKNITIGGVIGTALVAGALLLTKPTAQVQATGPVLEMTRANDVSYISFVTESNYFYLLFACTNLANPHWLKLYSEARGDGTIKTVIDGDHSPCKFYRVMRVTTLPSSPPYPPMPVSTTNQGIVL